MDFASDKDTRIMHRLSEHLAAVGGVHPEWVGIFLQGSQNYNLDYEGSDVDTKLIILPSFDDFALNRKPYSYTHVMENNEHVDVKDVRLMFDCFRKQNINFIEILFTKYFILNPKYADLFQPVLDAKERIGRYHNYAALNCMFGMALEKKKALCHPYPATMHKIEKYGFDGKQLCHINRIDEFQQRWRAGVPYAECLITQQRDRLLGNKLHTNCDLASATAEADEVVKRLEQMKKEYMETHPVEIDRGVDDILNNTLLSLFKYSFLSEIKAANRSEL